MLGAVGLVIVIQSDGSNYWRWQFPGLIVSVIGVVMAFAGVNTGLLMSFPPEQAGLAGGIFNMILQIGAVTLLSIQGGLLTTGEGLDDWTSWANGLWCVAPSASIRILSFFADLDADLQDDGRRPPRERRCLCPPLSA